MLCAVSRWGSGAQLYIQRGTLLSGATSSAWVFPATGDAGLSVGAALLCAAQVGELERTRIDHAYWGPEFSQAECQTALLETSGIVFRRVPCVAQEVAEYLAAGQVVDGFRGGWSLGHARWGTGAS